MPSLFEEVLKSFPHGILESLAKDLKSIDDRLSDECVGVLCAISTGFPTLISSPESGTGYCTGLTNVARFFPEGNFYFSEGHCVSLG